MYWTIEAETEALKASDSTTRTHTHTDSPAFRALWSLVLRLRVLSALGFRVTKKPNHSALLSISSLYCSIRYPKPLS